MTDKLTGLSLLNAIIFLLVCCNTTKICNNSGSVTYKGSFYDSSQHRYINDQVYFSDIKIWYRDSSVIERISGINSIDSVGFGYPGGHMEKRWVEVMYYTFIYLPTRSYYRYSSFTDSARLLEAFTQQDSVQVVGGWNFYTNKVIPDAGPSIILTDTIIDGIRYKRIRSSYKAILPQLKEKTKIEYVGYFDCRKKGTMFQLMKDKSDEVGCPMVRMDELPNPDYIHSHQSIIEFTTNKLTPEENKLFDTWEKYAKQHPVEKSVRAKKLFY